MAMLLSRGDHFAVEVYGDGFFQAMLVAFPMPSATSISCFLGGVRTASIMTHSVQYHFFF